jgi:2-haloacid dehalogenase
MKRVCVFDVNETLLDMAALDPLFERAFGDASVRKLWFNQMLQSAFVATITDAYTTFGEAAGAALMMTEERLGVEVLEADRQEILGGLRGLPPHPEVPDSLDRLREAGFRLATLTNSTKEVAESQIENARLADRFERILSADTAKRSNRRQPPTGWPRGRWRSPSVVCASPLSMPGTLRGLCAQGAPPSSPGSPSIRSSNDLM